MFDSAAVAEVVLKDFLRRLDLMLIGNCILLLDSSLELWENDI